MVKGPRPPVLRDVAGLQKARPGRRWQTCTNSFARADPFLRRWLSNSRPDFHGSFMTALLLDPHSSTVMRRRTRPRTSCKPWKRRCVEAAFAHSCRRRSTKLRGGEPRKQRRAHGTFCLPLLSPLSCLLFVRHRGEASARGLGKLPPLSSARSQTQIYRIEIGLCSGLLELPGSRDAALLSLRPREVLLGAAAQRPKPRLTTSDRRAGNGSASILGSSQKSGGLWG